MKEYVIWGIPPNQHEETLLLTSIQGKKMHSRAEAEKYKKVLEVKYGATKTRIQEIDMEGELDWMKEIGASLIKIAKSVLARRIALTSMMESALKEAGYDEDFIRKADDFMFDNERAMHLRKDQFLKFIQDNQSVIRKGNF